MLQLLVAATEVGGRMNAEAVDLVRSAAAARASSDPPPLRRHTARAWEARWFCLLSVAALDALAATLVQEETKLLAAPGATMPLSVEVWLDSDVRDDSGGGT